MPLTPLVAIHLGAALAALVLGPVVLWARRGRTQRPRLHRAFGYAWVTLMIATALSAVFIRDTHLPNIAGFTPIHLLVPVTLIGLVVAFRALARGDIAHHRRTMQRLYFGACVLAGVFTLLPNRLIGNLVVVQWLGLDAPTRARLSITAGQIVSHTPVFVWFVLAGLVVLGALQARQRHVSLTRATMLPLAIVALSLWGTASLFAGSYLALVLAGWSAAVAAGFATVVRRAPAAGTRFDPSTGSFVVPGSWIPMLLILAVFALRYATNVALALQPVLAADANFAVGIAACSGLFTGIFAARAARLRLLAQRSALPTLAASNLA
jgi:uncharacterized membrane protein